jgi:cytochrome P450
MHRHPLHWPDAEKFDPGRFLGEGGEGGSRQHPFAWIPFGGGPRRCIGEKLAMEEATYLTALLAASFKISIVEGCRYEDTMALTLKTKYGMNLRFEPMPLG